MSLPSAVVGGLENAAGVFAVSLETTADRSYLIVPTGGLVVRWKGHRILSRCNWTRYCPGDEPRRLRLVAGDRGEAVVE